VYVEPEINRIGIGTEIFELMPEANQIRILQSIEYIWALTKGEQTIDQQYFL